MQSEGEPIKHHDHTLAPLDPDELVQRSIEIFPQAYLTNISIIQGVALSVFVVETVIFLRDDSVPPAVAWPSLAQSLLMLVGIITVSYEYLWFTTIMRWTPTFRDTAIPFVLGVAEIVPPLLLGRPAAWWVSFAAFAALGAMAFMNTLSRIQPEMFPNHRSSYDEIRRLLVHLALLSVATAVGALAMAWIVQKTPTHQSTISAVAALTMAAMVLVVMIGYSELAMNNIYQRYGVARRPPLFVAMRNAVRPKGRGSRPAGGGTVGTQSLNAADGDDQRTPSPRPAPDSTPPSSQQPHPL